MATYGSKTYQPPTAPTMTPLQQYGQVAANRTPEEQAFYDQQQAAIQQQAAETAAGTWGPTGSEPSPIQQVMSQPAPPPPSTTANPNDPFAAMGGGVQLPGGGWVPANHPSAQGIAPTQATATPAAPAPAGPAGQTQATPQTIQQAYQNALQGVLTPAPITPESLRASPEARAQRLAGQRAEERQRGQLAERAAFQGFSDSGAMDTKLAGIRQQRAEGETGFIGQLAMARMEQQREELMAGIQFAQQAGQFAQAQALQRELATLNAAIQREGIQTGRSNVLDQLGYNYANLEANMNAELMRQLFS